MALNDLTKSIRGVTSKFKATGTTHNRLLPDRFSDEANVKDFGAVGDGVTDDSAAIQAAINTGKDVKFVSGETYYIGSTIRVTKRQTLNGNNCAFYFSRSEGYERCLEVYNAYGADIKDITFINKGSLNTSIAVWYFARQSYMEGCRFFGGWAVCIDLSQFKEGYLTGLHIENRDPTGITRVGSGIAIAHCLNIQITNSFIGYCERGITKGASIPDVSHGNEGITITENTLVTNNEQINIRGFVIFIDQNIIDITTLLPNGSAIICQGQMIKIRENWIADGNSTTLDSGRLIYFPFGAYQLTISGNIFWRGAQTEGSGKVIGIDLGTSTVEMVQIIDNIFAGRVECYIEQKIGAGGAVISGNLYDDGAVPISPINVKRLLHLDPQKVSKIPSLSSETILPNLLRVTYRAGFGTTGGERWADRTVGILTDTTYRGLQIETDNGVPTMWTHLGSGVVSTVEPSSSDAVLYVKRDTSTVRSINCAGTVNTQGNDYAEYMHKAPDCGVIQKGSVCGITKDGELTDIFDKAISFVVKSTDPSLVGGDSWFTETEPDVPQFESFTSTDEYNKAVTNYCKKHDEWSNAKDVERNKVDRIAFCGRVPVTVDGAKVGDYIEPVKGVEGVISCRPVSSPNFDEYRRSIGRVISVKNGITTIIVKIS